MRYFLDISYKGTHYHGWQIQHNAITVQEVLEKALSTLLRHPVATMGSGRTDTGVHALQQMVQFDTPRQLSHKNILNLNGILPRDIVVNHIYKVPDHASARFDAISRSYEYIIHKKPSPFFLETAYHFPKYLNVEKMRTASLILRQYEDFQCFSKSNTEVEHFLCDIKEVELAETEDKVVFKITANRFLRGMVRAIVGTLIDVGTEKIDIQHFESIIQSKDRKKAGRAAPPEGLFLCKVQYPDFLSVI
ncbi:MAG TPA: tRNA pseudouridine(38-40) synthase TruA [Cytophagales bacterium]|nr:tRNA pseudouridine(38-40) synthase TruA [Cytophagales bacterium]